MKIGDVSRVLCIVHSLKITFLMIALAMSHVVAIRAFEIDHPQFLWPRATVSKNSVIYSLLLIPSSSAVYLYVTTRHLETLIPTLYLILYFLSSDFSITTLFLCIWNEHKIYSYTYIWLSGWIWNIMTSSFQEDLVENFVGIFYENHISE